MGLCAWGRLQAGDTLLGMNSSSLVRAMSFVSLLAFLACLLFGAMAVMDGMNDPALLLATLLCLAWSYMASVWAEDHAAAREPPRARGSIVSRR